MSSNLDSLRWTSELNSPYICENKRTGYIWEEFLYIENFIILLSHDLRDGCLSNHHDSGLKVTSRKIGVDTTVNDVLQKVSFSLQGLSKLPLTRLSVP